MSPKYEKGKLAFKVIAGLCISSKAKAKAKKDSKEGFTVLDLDLTILILVFLVHNCVY